MAVITSSAAPIGALGDLLEASVNPNMGGWIGGPMANEIEAQTVRWIAEPIGYPTDCRGLLVSGGNMGNFIGLLATRKAKATWDVRAAGLLGEGSRRLRLYTSSETHTWIQKAADMFGLGTEAIRWMPVDTYLRPEALRETFSYHPPYYHWASQAEATVDYHEYGPQNSRGFRALKV